MRRGKKQADPELKEGLMHVLEKNTDIFNVTVETVGSSLQSYMETSGESGETLIDTFADVISDALEASKSSPEELERTAAGLMVGFSRAAENAGKLRLSTLGYLAEIILERAWACRASLTAVARGLIDGASLGGRRTALGVQEAVSETGVSVLIAAYAISAEAGDTIRKTLAGLVEEGYAIRLGDPLYR